MKTNVTEEKTTTGKSITRVGKDELKAWAKAAGWLIVSDSDEMTVYLTPSNDVRVIHYKGVTAYLRDPENIK